MRRALRIDPKPLCRVALLLLCLGCGGGQRAEPPSDPELESELNALQPESDGASSAGAAAACVDEACPELMLFGVRAPGCCRGSAGCGGRLRISSRSFACLPADYDRGTAALRAAVDRHAGAPVVPDDSCPSQPLGGRTLSGCCDPSGYCGLDTTAWTAELAAVGIQLPAACLPASEVAALTALPAPEGGLARACGPAAEAPPDPG